MAFLTCRSVISPFSLFFAPFFLPLFLGPLFFLNLQFVIGSTILDDIRYASNYNYSITTRYIDCYVTVRYRHNINADIRRGGMRDFGHKLLFLIEDVQDLTFQLHGEAKYGEFPSTCHFADTG